MNQIVQAIYAPSQSGKTTAAASLMLGYSTLGIPAAYIASRLEYAVGAAVRFGFQRENSFVWSSRLLSGGLLTRYHAIILDDVDAMQSSEGDPLRILAAKFATHAGQCPSIFGFYTGRTRSGVALRNLAAYEAIEAETARLREALAEAEQRYDLISDSVTHDMR
jgi:hypothetical protein